MSDYEVFELGDVVLQSGLTLRQAKLAYKTYGKLAALRDNALASARGVELAYLSAFDEIEQALTA